MTERRYSSRKFLLTVWGMCLLSVALFTGKLSGGEWVAAMSLLLGMYKGAQIADDRLNGKKEP